LIAQHLKNDIEFEKEDSSDSSSSMSSSLNSHVSKKSDDEGFEEKFDRINCLMAQSEAVNFRIIKMNEQLKLIVALQEQIVEE